MKWLLIAETKTPSDKESIDASFNRDSSDELYVPSVEFLTSAYEKLNVELYDNALPSTSEIKLAIGFRPKDVGIGVTEYYIDRQNQQVVPIKLILNSARTTTLHGWIEVVLHEMIHISDFIYHPEHFFGKKTYNPHGDWFFGRMWEVQENWNEHWRKTYGKDRTEQRHQQNFKTCR